MRLIDADAINPNDVFKGASDFAKDIRSGVIELIKVQPTIDPVKRAHWIDAVFTPYNSEDRQKAIQDYCNHGGNAAEWQTYTQYCSDCLTGFDVFDNDFIIRADYCPHCGANMVEEVPE